MGLRVRVRGQSSHRNPQLQQSPPSPVHCHTIMCSLTSFHLPIHCYIILCTLHSSIIIKVKVFCIRHHHPHVVVIVDEGVVVIVILIIASAIPLPRQLMDLFLVASPFLLSC